MLNAREHLSWTRTTLRFENRQARQAGAHGSVIVASAKPNSWFLVTACQLGEPPRR